MILIQYLMLIIDYYCRFEDRKLALEMVWNINIPNMIN